MKVTQVWQGITLAAMVVAVAVAHAWFAAHKEPRPCRFPVLISFLTLSRNMVPESKKA